MPEAVNCISCRKENNWHLNNVVDELHRVRQAWRDEHAKIIIVISEFTFPESVNSVPIP